MAAPITHTSQSSDPFAAAAVRDQRDFHTAALAMLRDQAPQYLHHEFTQPLASVASPLLLHPGLAREERDALANTGLKMVALKPAPGGLPVEDGIALYQGGRVLEVPQRIVLDGVSFCVNAKGCGATKLLRHRRKMVTDNQISRDTEKYGATFSSVPYSPEGLGCLTAIHALSEVRNTALFQAAGVRTQHILGLHALDALPGPDGSLRPLAELRECKLISPLLEPVILLRATHTNFRLGDLFALRELQMLGAARELLNLTIMEYSSITGRAATAQAYFDGVIDTAVRGDLKAATLGFIFGNRYQDMVRNITLMGEMVDNEGARFFMADDSTDTYEVLSHVSDIRNRLEALQSMGWQIRDLIESTSGETIDAACLADALFFGIEDCLELEAGKKLIDAWKDAWDIGVGDAPLHLAQNIRNRIAPYVPAAGCSHNSDPRDRYNRYLSKLLG